MRPYGIEATTHTGFSRSLEKRSNGEHQLNTSGHHRQKTKFQETSRLHKPKICQEDEFTQSTEFTIGRQRNNYEEYLHIQSALEYRTVTIGMRDPSNIDRLQVTGIPESMDGCYSVGNTRHKFQDDGT